jgi:5-methyltetrahydrofolate--homocysteine methyltransferase
MGIEDKLNELAEYIISGKHFEASKTTRQLVDEGAEPSSILDNGLMKGMEVVGKRFRDGQMFVPQVLVSARAMKRSLSVIEPLIVKDNKSKKGKVLIGTVKGDVHDIGKNLVVLMLQGAGYEVVDIGTGCTAEMFYNAYKEHQPDIVGMSALLTTTMSYMKEVVEKFKSKNVKVPVIVGGAPLNDKFSDSIGADGYAKNAYEAVGLVDRILNAENKKPV